MHDLLKTYHAYWQEAQLAALQFYKTMPADAWTILQQRLSKKYKKASKLLEKPQNVQGVLHNELMRFLVDALPTEQALTLIRYEIWANFTKGLPNFPVNYRNFAVYIADFIQYITHLAYRSEWYKIKSYTASDILEVFAMEKYIFLNQLQTAFMGCTQDLAFIISSQNRIEQSLTQNQYILNFLDLKISLSQFNHEHISQENVQLKKSEYYLEDIWHKNKHWHTHKVAVLVGKFKDLLHQRLQEYELQATYNYHLSLTNQALSVKNLQDFVLQYKATDKWKQRVKARLELKMQSGTLKMNISSLSYLYTSVKYGSILVFIANIFFGYSLYGQIPTISIAIASAVIGLLGDFLYDQNNEE